MRDYEEPDSLVRGLAQEADRKEAGRSVAELQGQLTSAKATCLVEKKRAQDGLSHTHQLVAQVPGPSLLCFKRHEPLVTRERIILKLSR